MLVCVCVPVSFLTFDLNYWHFENRGIKAERASSVARGRLVLIWLLSSENTELCCFSIPREASEETGHSESDGLLFSCG